MAQINLSEEEKIQIMEAINQGLEPSADLLPKIFPRTAEKFDVVALDRAKIPTLEYAGKRTKATILAEGTAGIGAAPLQVVRCFGEAKEEGWKNLIVQGDNLQFLKTCYKNTDPLIKDRVKGKVKLIYIDPPFGTGDIYGVTDGSLSYTAKIMGAEFIELLRERLVFLKELLNEEGSIYCRIDYHFGHYVKLIMDEVFGKENFINEIIINRTKRLKSEGNKFYISTDSLFFYTKSPQYFFKHIKKEEPYEIKVRFNDKNRAEEIKTLLEKYTIDCDIQQNNKNLRLRNQNWVQMHASSDNFNNPERNFLGVNIKPPNKRRWMWGQEAIDEMVKNNYIRINSNNGLPELIRTWRYLGSDWTDIQGYSQLTGYPTENSEELLERVINATTTEGDLVIDCFAGSGTTGSVAEKLGRHWILCDFGKHAIYIMQKRILRIAESKKMGGESKEDEKYGLEPKPFCVISSGAYDFTHIMDMRKNKDTYIDFALGLFQLSRDREKAAKFKIPNIYSVKDNNPVEVYPIWDDTYLKEIRIDEIYLQGILAHTGGRLRGDYYIITPESCTNISDTVIKNQDGKDVNFKILTFPYKILEDISQKLKLEDQPSSAADINNLITSTSFYFNEDVEIDIERDEEGLKITKFDTKILDGKGNRFEGLAGLAMILVDLDFQPGKPFDMDVAIYAKEIGDDGLCKIDNLTKKIGVIAIDKHGNESKPFEVK